MKGGDYTPINSSDLDVFVVYDNIEDGGLEAATRQYDYVDLSEYLGGPKRTMMIDINVQPFFNEWMIIATNQEPVALLHYSGRRKKKHKKNIATDMRMLADEIDSGKYSIGHYYFSPNAEGTLYDAFIVIGPNKYAIFNNTELSMPVIAVDPFWIKNQVHFVDLSEKFQADPLI